MAGIVVNGEPRDLDGVPAAHQRPRLPARLRADRRQGGLRRGRVRRLLGAWSPGPAPDGSDATEWTAINSCLVPAAALDGQEVVTVRGARLARRPAPGPARDGGARRLAVRLLHARLRLQHGRGVLPLRPGRHQRLGPARRLPRRERLRPARGQRQPVPLHRLPADQGRRLRARASRPPTTSSRPGVRRPRRRRWPPSCTTARRRTSARPTSAEALQLLRRPRGRDRRRRQHRLGRRRQPQGRAGRAGRRRRPAARAARLHDDRRPRSRIGAGADADRGRATAGRPAAAAAGADAAVRLAADPQRRHPRRQPRHRLADRRRPAGAARPRGVGGAGLDRRASARCRWPTTSPATASPYAARAS